MDRQDKSHLPYVPALDGLRAVAIMAVLAFHVWPAALRGGFMGVDVFFVLSGFLITSIILHDIRRDGFSIKEFYLRRIQRLVPNLAVMVLAVLVLWKLLMPPGSEVEAARNGLWTLLYSSNIYIWMNLGNYWGANAEWAPLTHTWSLGVEEQFYLGFPIAVLILARFQPRRMRRWFSVAAAISFALFWYGTHHKQVATFYLLPTRFWELLLGAILAAHRTPVRIERPLEAFPFGETARGALAWIGLGMTVFAFTFAAYGTRQGYQGLISLAPTLGTVLVLLAIANGETSMSRFLSSPPMTGVGKFSYSLYLWHWPLIVLGKAQADRHGLPQLAGAVAGGLSAIFLSWVAYAWIERPLRKRGLNRRWRLAAIAAGLTLAMLCCGVLANRKPVVDPLHRFDTVTVSATLYNAGRPSAAEPWYGKLKWPGIQYADVDYPPVPASLVDSWRRGGIVHLFGGVRPSVVVLGSSHAEMYSPVIDEICRARGLSVAFLGTDGTPAFFESTVNENFSSPLEAHEFDEARRRCLREWRPDAVFAIDRWDVQVDTPQLFDLKLRSFLREAAPLAGRVVLVAQVPVLEERVPTNLRGLITWRMGARNGLPRLEPDSRDPLRKQFIAVETAAKADFPSLRILRADLPFYQADGSVRYAAGRTCFYVDDNHLSDAGSEVVRGLFDRAIAEAHGSAVPPPPVQP